MSFFIILASMILGAIGIGSIPLLLLGIKDWIFPSTGAPGSAGYLLIFSIPMGILIGLWYGYYVGKHISVSGNGFSGFTQTPYLYQVIAVVLILISVVAIARYAIREENKPKPQNQILVDYLLNTSWIQIDESGKEIDFKISFESTKDTDLKHYYYDYTRYTQHNPPSRGYWITREGRSTMHVVGDSIFAVFYRDINVTGDILTMSHGATNTRFKRVQSTH